MADHAHNHDGDHHNHHVHGEASEKKNWTQINKAHWDQVASTYNSTHTQKEFGDLINKITAFLIQNVNWIGVPFLDPSTSFENQTSSSSDKSVRVLDYACGPGTVTAALAGYATEYVGIDLSNNMVKEYNNRFNPEPTEIHASTDPSLPQPKGLNAHAVVGDLLDPKGTPSSLDDPKYHNFDLAAVSGGFHHFENVELATQRLAERLKPGGVLIIFDFQAHPPNDIHDNPAIRTVVHHGFDEDQVRKLFGGAGLQDVEIRNMAEPVMLRGKALRHGFLARGKKPV